MAILIKEKKGGYFFMDKIQKINCKVNSCAFNNTEKNMCELDGIMVQPCKKCSNGKPEDESMCGNYKNIK